MGEERAFGGGEIFGKILQDLGIGGWEIKGWVFSKFDCRSLFRFIWRRTGTGGRLLCIW